MIYTTTITKSGQISLPKSIREALNLTIGGKVTLDYSKSKLTIRRKMTDEEFFAKMDSLISDKTRSLFKKNAEKSISELKSAYEKTENFKNNYKEKYGL